MERAQCYQCQHFYQHYGLGERALFCLNCGHCTVPRLRHKKPDAPACTHFHPGADQAEGFVTTQYLTRALLEKVLSLPLLPDIHEKT